MGKLIKTCCMACLGASFLFVAACNEEKAPGPELTRSVQVVSKSVPKSNRTATQTTASGKAGKKPVQTSDLKPESDTEKAGRAGDGIDGEGNLSLPKVGISKPMEKYDSKGRVDPFIPLIAEKYTSVASGSPGESKPKRILTPLEKLGLSQIKLVAVVEMPDRIIAMVEEASGKGYEVAIGTYIGKNGGQVTSITREGIKIEEKVKNYKGKFSKRYEEIKFHKSEDGE